MSSVEERGTDSIWTDDTRG